MMRLLVIGHSFVTAFAQKKYVAMKQLAPSLQLKILVPERVHHPFMTYTCEPAAGLERDEIVPLQTSFPFRSHMTYLFWPQQLYRCIKDFRPDVLHIEEEPQALITAQTVCLTRYAAPQAALCLFTWDNMYRRRRFPLSLIKRTLGRYSLQRCAAVVCGNREAEELLRKQRGYRGFITILPQIGVDPECYGSSRQDSLRPQLGMSNTVCIGYMGRLVPEKGILLLLEALTSLEQYSWKLLLVGSGSLADQIRAQWTDRFKHRIVCVPAVPHREVSQYLRCVDIFVLPSYGTPHWREQFGLTLTQAMLMGVPAVGSSSGAIPEVLGPGGFIFTEGNVDSLAAALEQLLASKEKRKELGEQARVFAIQNYTARAVAARYLNVFETVYEHAQCA